MAEPTPSPFWAKVVATITGCAAIGALVGLLGGALTGNVGRGLAAGVVAGAVVAAGLVVWQGERLRGP
ncbi:hypothetical protein [Terracoccus luteus]|uniref:Uncharacterized protein n=1 Tax=Terracoccus luteus TaxID=53356 RepID=A0A495Y4J4_9MICO|nr:hypothetical protein [Terracoccus luteus]MBB2988364.1 hypothetical protein [Terracoccus luteus]MCP2174006.1 hypothetical protein [Terracoccus luteus]RKT79488.1 hypothetical protein DFJ68_2961 [Terracoccus luteus]